jgi:hypothetical protein
MLPPAAASCALSIQSNDFRGIILALTSAQAQTYISNTAVTYHKTLVIIHLPI